MGRELRVALELLESQAAGLGFTDPAHVAAAFPASYRATIKGYFASYADHRVALMEAIEQANQAGIVGALTEMMMLNKRFLLAGINRYKELIQELDPLEIVDEPLED